MPTSAYEPRRCKWCRDKLTEACVNYCRRCHAIVTDMLTWYRQPVIDEVEQLVTTMIAGGRQPSEMRLAAVQLLESRPGFIRGQPLKPEKLCAM